MRDNVMAWTTFAKLFVASCVAAVCVVCFGCESVVMSNERSTSVGAAELSVLSESQASELYIGEVDERAARELGLYESAPFEDAYRQAAAAYMALWNYRLCDKGDLDDYQVMLDEHPWDFPSGNASDSLRVNGSFGRANLLIRNTAYVERLSRADLDLLMDAVNRDVLVVSDDLLEMLDRTLSDVIEVRYSDYEGQQSILYSDGLFTGPEMAPSNALVIVLSYGVSLDQDGALNQEVEAEKSDMAATLAGLMESELAETQGCPVVVFIEG